MSQRIKTPTECPNTKERLQFNRNALKHDTLARHAMIRARRERLGAIENQDLMCLKRMQHR